MVEIRLLVTAAASLATALAFLGVAYVLSRRDYPSHARLAGFAFVLWWTMFGLEAMTDGLRVLLAVGGDPHVGAYLALVRLKIVFAGIAIWGLAYYVLYLWRGARNAAFPLVLFALSHVGLFTWATEARDPTGVVLGEWAPRLVLGEQSGLLPALQPVLFAYFFLPPVVLAIALFALAPRLDSRTRRFRVVSVGVVIVGWHATQVVLADPSASGDSPVFALLSIVNVLVAVLAATTYRPPAILQKRLGLRGLQEEADRAPANARGSSSDRVHG